MYIFFNKVLTISENCEDLFVLDCESHMKIGLFTLQRALLAFVLYQLYSFISCDTELDGVKGSGFADRHADAKN